MKTYHIISIFLIFFCFQISFGQERIISGKVLDQNLLALPLVLISYNSKVIDTSDFNGNFKFKATSEMKKIAFSSLGFQTEEVNVPMNCEYIGIILLEVGTYDFVTLKKAKRKIERRRKKLLPKLYAEAYEKKLLDKEKSCDLKPFY